jgi:transposase
MHYAKPYPRDYRRPDDAEQQLAERLQTALEGVSGDVIVGFMDEASPQTTANTQRFWSFEKPKIAKNTSKIRANTFGFYPVNGREVVEFMSDSKSPRVCEFLRKIRWKNPVGDILIILDNARGHIAAATRAFAERLNIRLVFLPPYSPDLNPIEHIWRPVKKKLSQMFAKTEYTFKETIRTTFHRHAKKPTFMQNWIETYNPILSDFLCP